MLHDLAERIVATGVQNDQPKLLCRLDDRQHAVKRYRLVERVDIAFKGRVDRNEIIDAVDFHPVARVIDDRNVSVTDVVGEVAQRAAHFIDAKIVLELDDIESGALEHRRSGIGVPGWI